MQVPHSAYLRGDAAGICHLQPVVPCCLRFPLQGPSPKGNRSPLHHSFFQTACDMWILHELIGIVMRGRSSTTAAYHSCFQLSAMHESCKILVHQLYEAAHLQMVDLHPFVSSPSLEQAIGLYTGCLMADCPNCCGLMLMRATADSATFGNYRTR